MVRLKEHSGRFRGNGIVLLASLGDRYHAKRENPQRENPQKENPQRENPQREMVAADGRARCLHITGASTRSEASKHAVTRYMHDC